MPAGRVADAFWVGPATGGLPAGGARPLGGCARAPLGQRRLRRGPRPPVPSLVRGVALHDRGYGQLDADGIGEVYWDRWTAIQQAGFTPTGDDPVVDLVVAMHVQRLVSWGRSDADEAVAARMAAVLPLDQAAAGVDAARAAEADAITNLCDMVAFDFCVEREASGSVAVAPTAGAEPVAVSDQLDGAGGIVLSPWPLGVTELSGLALAFRA